MLWININSSKVLNYLLQCLHHHRKFYGSISNSNNNNDNNYNKIIKDKKKLSKRNMKGDHLFAISPERFAEIFISQKIKKQHSLEKTKRGTGTKKQEGFEL